MPARQIKKPLFDPRAFVDGLPRATGTFSGTLDLSAPVGTLYQRVRNVAASVDYKTGFKVEAWTAAWGGDVEVRCTIPVQVLPSEGSDAPTKLVATRMIRGDLSEEEIAQILLATVIEAEAHEACEWFRVNSRMVCDPHREPPLKYAVQNPMPLPQNFPPLSFKESYSFKDEDFAQAQKEVADLMKPLDSALDHLLDKLTRPPAFNNQKGTSK